MANTLLELKSNLVRETIRKAFMALFAQKGLEKVTVSEICSASGVSRSAFYRYYDDKYEILDDVENTLLKGLQEINRGIHLEHYDKRDVFAVVPQFEETAAYIRDNKEYFIPLMTTPGDGQFLHKWKLLMYEDFLRRFRADKVMPAEFVELQTSAMTSAMVGMYEYWLVKQPHITPDEFARIGTKLLFRSFYIN